MKKLLTIIIILFALTGYSQSYNGIELGKNITYTKKVIVNKGYKYHSVVTDNSITYYKYINGKKTYITLVYTPYTNLVWKILVTVDYASSWMDAKNKYLKYFYILNNKYGEQINENIKFESPYYEGDGYEIQALYLDKAEIYTIYKDQNDNLIMLELDSFNKNTVEILIHYENNIASEINKQELIKKNNKIY